MSKSTEDGEAGPLPFAVHIPFASELGMQLWAFGGGKAELQLPLRAQHLNSGGMAHGGVVMALLDVAMAHAARSPDGAGRAPGPGVVTIEMKTSFMRPAQGRLTARGTLLHKTLSMAFTEGSVFDSAGALCAHATGTFKFLRQADVQTAVPTATLPPPATAGDEA